MYGAGGTGALERSAPRDIYVSRCARDGDEREAAFGRRHARDGRATTSSTDGSSPRSARSWGSAMSGAAMTSRGGAAAAATHATHANLYVKNISDRIDELTLRELFEACGEVRSCCVIRDVSTNRSRGFGFVKFAEVEKAEDAIAKFHGKEYAGKTLEVKFANTDGESDDANPVANATPSDNIYVKGLPPTWTHDDLKTYFSEFGHIIECRLLHANKSTSSGALIRFLRDAEATEAVTRGNGRMLVGVSTPLVVRYAEPQGKSKRAQGSSSPPQTSSALPMPAAVPLPKTLPIARRDDSAHDEMQFNDMFNSMGIKSIPSIPSNNSLNDLLGVFAQNEEDVAAMAVLGSSPSRFDIPREYASASMQQALPQPSVQPVFSAGFTAQQPTSVPIPRFYMTCVQNLPITANELMLYQLFAPYGAILSAQVLRDEWTGLCTGIGVVNFRNELEALDAKNALHMKPIGNNILSITVRPPH